MRFSWILLTSAVLAAACHPGPVGNVGAKQPPVGGTIAGIVKTADASVAVPGRKVTVIDTVNGTRYDTTTASNGGYTIRVPQGTYRIEVELRQGEAPAQQPGTPQNKKNDLHAGGELLITTPAPPERGKPRSR